MTSLLHFPKAGPKVCIKGYARLTFPVVDVLPMNNRIVLQHPFTGAEMAFSMGELQEAVIHDHR